MTFGEIIRDCRRGDNSIKHIQIEIESVEAQRLNASGPNNIIPSGFSAPLQSFRDDEKLSELEVLGLGIKDDTTLTVVL